jgi:RNA polymerase sigma-70 factor, ECF subfamily
MDESDLVGIYERTVDEVYRYANRLAGGDRQRAEDLTQDAFLMLVREVRSGRSDELGASWLITCVRNRFIDQVRHSAMGERRLRLVPASSSDGGDGPGDTLLTEIPALARLSDTERVAVVLHHLDGYPVSEVAHRLGRSIRATESLLVRARSRLRLQWGVEQRG